MSSIELWNSIKNDKAYSMYGIQYAVQNNDVVISIWEKILIENRPNMYTKDDIDQLLRDYWNFEFGFSKARNLVYDAINKAIGR